VGQHRLTTAQTSGQQGVHSGRLAQGLARHQLPGLLHVLAQHMRLCFRGGAWWGRVRVSTLSGHCLIGTMEVADADGGRCCDAVSRTSEHVGDMRRCSMETKLKPGAGWDDMST
jgi:hypothetical protein